MASGPVDFKTSAFTIVMTGGTNTYLGVRGEVTVASATNNAVAKKRAPRRSTSS